MSKPCLYLTVFVVLIAAAAGCQRPVNKTQVPRQNTAQDIPAGEITVRLLTDASGINDKSFNASAWRGILEFYGDTPENLKKKGFFYDVIAVETHDLYAPELKQTAKEGYDLIIVTGFTWTDALTEVAGEYPMQKFLIVDIDTLGDFPNVMQAAYAEHEGSYLAGVAAALKAKEDGIANPRFGFIGGIPGVVITRFQVGFVQGILSVLPAAEILDYYTNSWNEPALAKTQARNWYDSGVYAVFSVAGRSGGGTIAQAAEYRAAGKNVWAIGSDSDQHDEGMYAAGESAVLTSMLKRVDTIMLYALQAVRENIFEGEIVTFNLSKGGVDYTATGNALSPGIIAELESIRRQIVSGEITVAATHAQARELPGFPQNLKAVDD